MSDNTPLERLGVTIKVDTGRQQELAQKLQQASEQVIAAFAALGESLRGPIADGAAHFCRFAQEAPLLAEIAAVSRWSHEEAARMVQVIHKKHGYGPNEVLDLLRIGTVFDKDGNITYLPDFDTLIMMLTG